MKCPFSLMLNLQESDEKFRAWSRTVVAACNFCLFLFCLVKSWPLIHYQQYISGQWLVFRGLPPQKLISFDLFCFDLWPILSKMSLKKKNQEGRNNNSLTFGESHAQSKTTVHGIFETIVSLFVFKPATGPFSHQNNFYCWDA